MMETVTVKQHPKHNEMEFPVPEEGWIYEKDEAAKAMKCERNEQTILRLARAYHKVREWEKLIKLVTSALEEIPLRSVDGNAQEQGIVSSKFYCEQLTAWHKEAKDTISAESRFDEIGIHGQDRIRVSNIDMISCLNESFNNLNILHCAAFQGDIRSLEEAVALGAAIDYPVGEPAKDSYEGKEEAPRGTTALLLACSILAMYGAMPQQLSSTMLREETRLAE